MGVLSAQKVIAQTSMFGRQTHVQMLAGDSKHRAASAGLLGEPASMQAAGSLCYVYGVDASRYQQQACV
jgi:hypothetical protein